MQYQKDLQAALDNKAATEAQLKSMMEEFQSKIKHFETQANQIKFNISKAISEIISEPLVEVDLNTLSKLVHYAFGTTNIVEGFKSYNLLTVLSRDEYKKLPKVISQLEKAGLIVVDHYFRQDDGQIVDVKNKLKEIQEYIYERQYWNPFTQMPLNKYDFLARYFQTYTTTDKYIAATKKAVATLRERELDLENEATTYASVA